MVYVFQNWLSTEHLLKYMKKLKTDSFLLLVTLPVSARILQALFSSHAISTFLSPCHLLPRSFPPQGLNSMLIPHSNGECGCPSTFATVEYIQTSSSLEVNSNAAFYPKNFVISFLLPSANITQCQNTVPSWDLLFIQITFILSVLIRLAPVA